MLRVVENANHEVLIKLLKNIKSGVESMIHNYTNLYTKEELALFDEISKLIDEQIKKVSNGNCNNNEMYKVLEYEKYLKPYAFRCWDREFKNGCQYISWFKNDKVGDTPQVISSTFLRDINDTFCDSRYGINYKVLIDGFLGACNKDAATLVEAPSRESIYTIGKTIDGKTINSYNLATPIITPIQIFDKSSNNYKSKHNELVLDSRYVKPISVVYTSDNDLEIVKLISEKCNIPLELKSNSKIV